MTTFVVEPHEDGYPVLKFLRRRIPAAGQGYLRQLLKKGRISCNGICCSETFAVSVGQQIQLANSARLQELLKQDADCSSGIEVLYESPQMLAVNKPAGLAVHSSEAHEHDNLTLRVQKYFAGQRFQVAPVHRLDVGTSGPVLFGKGRKACSVLGGMFMRHEVEKNYIAMVAGNFQGQGMLTDAVPSKGKPRPSCTMFKVKRRSESATMVELTLITGRQHQIRHQLAQQGHPIYADTRYGGPALNGLSYPFLHCLSIAFVDPFSGAPLKFESPLPPQLQAAAEEFFEAVTV